MRLTKALQQGLFVGMTVLLLGLPLSAKADDRVPEHTLMVQGTGQVTAKPDAIQLQMGVETEARTQEEARNQNAGKMAQVIQRLKGLGIPGLVVQTSYFNVYPIRKSDRMAPTGFHAQNSLTAKVEGVTDADKLGSYASQLLDTAIAAGATDVNGPNFYLSQNNKAQQEALRLAIAQARQTAETMADAAGVHLTGIYTMESYNQGSPMRAMAKGAPMMTAEAVAAPTPVEVGDFDVSANVTIRFSFQN